MSFARFDDKLAFHPKVLAAGDEAFGLWVRLVTYCCAHHTDGFLTDEQLRAFPAKKTLISKLLRVRLLDRSKGGVLVHDFLDWNPSAEQAKAKQTDLIEKRRKAGYVGGKRSGEVRKNKQLDQANGEANGEAKSKQTGKHFASKQTNPDPIRTDPKEENPPKPPQGGAVPSAPESEPTPRPRIQLTAKPWYVENQPKVAR